MTAAIDRELYVCPAEDYSRCDLIGPYRGPGAHHHCEYDEGHDERLHECACGYQWPNQPEET